MVYRRDDGTIGWSSRSATRTVQRAIQRAWRPVLPFAIGSKSRHGREPVYAMNDLSDLLSPDAIDAALSVTNKKTLFQQLASAGGRLTDLPAKQILASLQEREKLGSTGFGNGVAIPHGKIEGLPRISGYFTRLSTPIDYHAVDNLPVDLVFLLLSPPDAELPSQGAALAAGVRDLCHPCELRVRVRRAISLCCRESRPSMPLRARPQATRRPRAAHFERCKPCIVPPRSTSLFESTWRSSGRLCRIRFEIDTTVSRRGAAHGTIYFPMRRFASRPATAVPDRFLETASLTSRARSVAVRDRRRPVV